MAEINLQKRAVYAGDVHIALLKSGWSIREACDFVNGLPKADVAEVRHARWDENGRCTGCGEHAPYYGMASAYHASPYCFGCGARMDGGADNGE